MMFGKLERRALRSWLCAFCAVLGCASLPAAQAADYPTRPVSLIVPQTPGGANDIIARQMGEALGRIMNGNFVVVNKAGSGGNIGTEFAARSTPDGYTLLLTISTHVINPFVYKSVGYDPVKDFDPIALLAVVPTVLVAHPSFPANNVAELLALARQQPGKIAYAHGGNGTLNHIAGEKLKTETGVQILAVPYRGAAPALVDVLSGIVPTGFATLPSTLEHINSGRLKALGISGATRSAAAPRIPTIGETVPKFAMDLWVGLLAVAGTPKPVIASLEGAVARALESEALRKNFAGQGAEPQKIGPAEFANRIKAELVMYKDVVQASGATAN